jgi:photosystem II stability/assembly factor-like uncharacterized protein
VAPFNATEPTVGVAADGTIFAAGLYPSGVREYATDDHEYVAMTKDEGATWSRIFDPLQPPVDQDPRLWLDPHTQRLFNAPDGVACGNLAWTDDEGRTWGQNPAAACPLPGQDQQKISTGPPPPGIKTHGYPDLLYYIYGSLLPNPTQDGGTDPTGSYGRSTFVSVSLDGGATWQAPTMAHASDPCSDGLSGRIVVAPDGTAYFSKSTCTGVDVVRSDDGGATWKVVLRETALGAFPEHNYSPGLAVDADGRVCLVFLARDARAYFMESSTRGAMWSPPLRLSPPATTSTAFVAASIVAPGRIVVSTIQTESPSWPSLAPTKAPVSTVWQLWVSEAALEAQSGPTSGATWTRTQVTPADRPVQVGCIWLAGTPIQNTTSCRNMGDFIDIEASGGRPYVAFVEGCQTSCRAGTQTTDSKLAIAYPLASERLAQSSGPSSAPLAVGGIPTAP